MSDERRTERPVIAAAPFVWRDPASIPRRAFIYGRHYARRFVSTTLAPGGVGKTSLSTVEALAIVTGRPLLGVTPTESCAVWLLNEDPFDEIERRVHAALQQYGITPSEIEGRLFVNSMRDTDLIIAEQGKNGITVNMPAVDALITSVRVNRVGVVFADPLVSTHRVGENDNVAMDRVVKAWGRVADATGCAVELIHHTRKSNGGEMTVEDGRGASAVLGAARSARILNPMSDDEAARAGVDDRRSFFRVDVGKANMAPAEATTWRKLESVTLANGDHVAVAMPWTWPDPFASVTVDDLRKVQEIIAGGEWAENAQASNWAGCALAQALALDLESPRDKAKAKTLLRTWIANGVLKVEQRHDKRQGRTKGYIVKGETA